MKKRKILTAFAFASLATLTLASCNGVKNEYDAKKILMAEALSSLAEDKIQNITIDLVSEGNKDIYVSPTGTKDGDGSKANPYDFVTATTKVTPGTNIKMAAGTYTLNQRVPIGKEDNLATAQEVIYNGAPGQFVTVQPENKGDRVIFDFSEMAFADSNRGLQVYGDYWYFYGLEVTGAGDNGMYIAGNHNIVDQCMFYNNRDTGLQIGRGGSSQATLDQWPGYNLVRNCTSFANYDDQTLGENADGFAAKLTVGHMNIFDGCIAFRNSDDGWDLYAKQDSGNIGTVILYNCVSFENGFLPYIAQDVFATDTQNPGRGYDTQNGDGIGFKLGGSTMTGDVVVENCLAFNNKYHGVSDNSNPGFISVKNFTAYNNCAGVGLDGKVTDTRGISYATNKSNNIDLARTVASYNDFYGVLSYVNNQEKYKAEGDNLYNADAYRGSTAYSIFQTTYEFGEKYKAYTDVKDGSSYHTEYVDAPFDGGADFDNISDADFKDLNPINAICASRDKDLLYALGKSINDAYRNADGSVNMHDKMALADNSSLKTFADGEAVGATLNKSSISEYTHPDYFSFETANPNMTSDMERVLSAYMALNPITNQNSTFQDFNITNLINGCEIKWESSNTDVIQITNDETVSKSMSVESIAHILVPEQKTTVQLTATIRYATATVKKTFDIVVYPRNQYLGELKSTSTDVIRVQIYSTYYAPKVYPIDASSINNNEFDDSLYTLEYKYEFAADGNSKFYEVDDIYTSVPGLYRITAIATSTKDATQVSKYTFKVYVVDPDCSIDFINQESKIILSADGFAISGNLSNVEGYVKAFTSTTDLGNLTAEQIATRADVQTYQVQTDTIVAQFNADNNATTDTAYYIYYTVVNDNLSNINEATAYKAEVKTKEVSSEQEFMKLARTGSPDSGSYSDTLTIFYLSKDLDFTGIAWDVSTTADAFNGLFNGNNHTISHIHYEGKPSTANYVNIFYQVKNGSIMNVTFDDIKLKCQDSSNGKRMGIIGAMQGGFLQNVRITNSSFVGYESVGGLVGQITGGDNFISRCSLVNPIEFFTPTTDTTFQSDVQYYEFKYQENDDTYNYVKIDLTAETSKYKAGETIPTGDKATDKIYILPNNYTITSKNKYQAGLVGNAQIADSATYLNLSMSNCLVTATIGDGNDTGGNTGGILGRCKNDSDKYTVELSYNYFNGNIISLGLYGAGILGDLDNGMGRIIVHNNMAIVTFVYKGQWLNVEFRYDNAIEACKQFGNSEPLSELQKYAHKNLNPIIGRATSSDAKLYDGSKNNIGNWSEYYSKLSVSYSIYFNMSSYDEESEDSFIFVPNARTFSVTLGFDMENIWIFNETTGQPELR